MLAQFNSIHFNIFPLPSTEPSGRPFLQQKPLPRMKSYSKWMSRQDTSRQQTIIPRTPSSRQEEKHSRKKSLPANSSSLASFLIVLSLSSLSMIGIIVSEEPAGTIIVRVMTMSYFVHPLAPS